MLNRTTADLVRLLFDAGEMVTGTQSLADEMIELIAESLGAEVLLVEPGQEAELELQAAGLHLVIYSALLIVVMLYFPGGIAGAIARIGGRRKP